MSETSSCQVNPWGMNSGAIHRPMMPIYEFSMSLTMPEGPKYPKAHTMMEATRMMPPIFFRYSFPFSHVCLTMALAVGHR